MKREKMRTVCIFSHPIAMTVLFTIMYIKQSYIMPTSNFNCHNCSIPNHQQALHSLSLTLLLCQVCNAAIRLIPTCIKDFLTEIQVDESFS